MESPRDKSLLLMKMAREKKFPQTFLAANGNRLPTLPMDLVVPGALPIVGFGWNPATKLYRLLDLVTLWGFGDFEDETGCAAYYNPDSAWYNVFYGSYLIRSYKRDGAAWGYNRDGSVNLDELLQISEIDYNFITAAAFGCPPEKMSFEARVTEQRRTKNEWDFTVVDALVPSGLHDSTQFTAEDGTLDVFGTPHQSFMRGRDSFEPVQLHGEFFMRKLHTARDEPPVTLVWGAACPVTPDGAMLLRRIMEQLADGYMDIV
jgi:hypothetical protein